MKIEITALIVAGGLVFGGVAVRSVSAQTNERGATTSKTTGQAKSKYGESGLEMAQEISKEDAMKKYPPRNGTFPVAESVKGPETGVSTTLIESPYPPHHKFDTTGINRGALILDPYTKHVFVKP